MKQSAHMAGLAVDIACPDSVTRLKILRGLIVAGFRRITATFEEHTPAVMLLLKRVSDEAVWADLLTGETDDDTADSYTFAYCYLLLAETVELLNLKTLGEGIIKTTGIDTQQTARTACSGTAG